MSALEHIDVHHRYPWTRDDERFLARAKRARVPHKRIATVLRRTPRAIDEKVYKLKQEGRLQYLLAEAAGDSLSRHESEEAELLERMLQEARRR